MALVEAAALQAVRPLDSVFLPTPMSVDRSGTDLSAGATYIPPLAGLGQSMTAMAVVPVASALLGPVVGLGSAKAVTSHFRYGNK